MSEKRIKECWACGIPAKCDVHHIIPQYLGGSDEKYNLIDLCEPCHSLLDRRRLQNSYDISWFMKEANKQAGPRWARLLLLEFNKFIAFLKFRYGIQMTDFTTEKDLITSADLVMIQFLGAISEFESKILKEMIKAGLTNEIKGYSHKGKKLGQPKKPVDEELIKRLNAEGKSLREIGRMVGVSYATIKRYLDCEKKRPLKKYEFPNIESDIDYNKKA